MIDQDERLFLHDSSAGFWLTSSVSESADQTIATFNEHSRFYISDLPEPFKKALRAFLENRRGAKEPNALALFFEARSQELFLERRPDCPYARHFVETRREESLGDSVGCLVFSTEEAHRLFNKYEANQKKILATAATAMDSSDQVSQEVSASNQQAKKQSSTLDDSFVLKTFCKGAVEIFTDLENFITPEHLQRQKDQYPDRDFSFWKCSAEEQEHLLEIAHCWSLSTLDALAEGLQLPPALFEIKPTVDQFSEIGGRIRWGDDWPPACVQGSYVEMVRVLQEQAILNLNASDSLPRGKTVRPL